MKKVVMYTSEYCPYCVRAKELFNSLEIEFEEISVTDYPEKREELIQKHNWMTVPAIFFDGELIGGFDDVNELHHQNKLLEKLG